MTRYDVTHPNGMVFVVDDAPDSTTAKKLIRDQLHESAVVELTELSVRKSENQDPTPEVTP